MANRQNGYEIPYHNYNRESAPLDVIFITMEKYIITSKQTP